MKVVGTKLDDSDYDRFETFCIDEGLSKSEILRGMIKRYCDACEDYSDENNQPPTKDLEIKSEDATPIAHGKILDDDGNVIGTF